MAETELNIELALGGKLKILRNRRLERLRGIVLVTFVFLPICSVSLYADTVVSSDALLEDFAIMHRALDTLHPGLLRYNTPDDLELHWSMLRNEFSRDQTVRNAYLLISGFTASIGCGHTYPNPYNQSPSIKQEVLGGSDKLPFAFQIVDNRMFVTKDASDGRQLGSDVEIVTIDGVTVSDILETLLHYVKADGANNQKRIHDLQVFGSAEFEAFDVYFPLLFPPNDGSYDLTVRDRNSEDVHDVSLKSISAAKRTALIQDRYDTLPDSDDELWEFKHLDVKTAYLKLGTFVTWHMTMNWSKFLRDAFEELRTRQTPNLVIDIRGNEGGEDAVYKYLLRNIATEPIIAPLSRELLKYDEVPEDLRGYLDTWDSSFYDRRLKVESAGSGFFTWRSKPVANRGIVPVRAPYRGRVFLLINSANSSGAFLLAHSARKSSLATLVGQTTGGNLRGINGGQMFFLRLPNTGIEIDVPLIGYYPEKEIPDSGLAPDILVPRSIEGVLGGEDPELEIVLEAIRAEG